MNIRVILVSSGLIFTLIVSCQNKPSTVKLNSEVDTISYYLGVSIGNNFKNSPMKDLNIEALAKGLSDVVNGKDTISDINTVNMAINQYMRKCEAIESQKNLEDGEAFLARNKKRNEVITTVSGLQYEVIREGSGPRPKETDTVTVHYHGTLLDGRVFDSSVDRNQPATFPLDRVIPGWTEGVQLMSVGSKYKFYVPANLAYGARPRPGGIIRPNMALIFEIELLSINAPANEGFEPK
jgi:FKBP-type peptidyl-prolyl cis-trans isomerase